jgi:hypothetical protein
MTDLKSTQYARKGSRDYFRQTQTRDSLMKKDIEKERAASAAKTAKLRALRLARDEAERAATAESDSAGTKSKARGRNIRRISHT